MITADNPGSSDHINEEPVLSTNIGGRLENQCCVCFRTYEEDLRSGRTDKVSVGSVCV